MNAEVFDINEEWERRRRLPHLLRRVPDRATGLEVESQAVAEVLAKLDQVLARLARLEDHLGLAGDSPPDVAWRAGVTAEQAAGEIMALLRQGRSLRPSELEQALGIDIEVVLQAVHLLTEQGRVGVDHDALQRILETD